MRVPVRSPPPTKRAVKAEQQPINSPAAPAAAPQDRRGPGARSTAGSFAAVLWLWRVCWLTERVTGSARFPIRGTWYLPLAIAESIETRSCLSTLACAQDSPNWSDVKETSQCSTRAVMARVCSNMEACSALSPSVLLCIGSVAKCRARL
jgi:hypothetical protein